MDNSDSSYLVMEDFKLITYPEPEEPELITRQPDFLFTHRRPDYLLDLDPLPSTSASADEIRDLGKADSLVKLLACLQAIFLELVCITRLAVELPVSQFAIHTCEHPLCALTMYVSWSQKPKDVKTQTPIPDNCSNGIALQHCSIIYWAWRTELPSCESAIDVAGAEPPRACHVTS